MKGLSNNQLKILAMIAMTLDHVGAYLLPQVMWLRIVGRLAFPIYAFMIAEGCRHTRSMPRYFFSLAAMAAVCQLVYFFAMGSLYMCIMVTFTLSVGLIWLVQEKRNTFFSEFLLILGFIAAYFICQRLPSIIPNTDYGVDYGFFGVLVPVIIYLFKTKTGQLLSCALALCCLASQYGAVQYYSLLALIPLLLYNGQRGRKNMKWFFYLYYPAHLVAIYGISLLF